MEGCVATTLDDGCRLSDEDTICSVLDCVLDCIVLDDKALVDVEGAVLVSVGATTAEELSEATADEDVKYEEDVTGADDELNVAACAVLVT